MSKIQNNLFKITYDHSGCNTLKQHCCGLFWCYTTSYDKHDEICLDHVDHAIAKNFRTLGSTESVYQI